MPPSKWHKKRTPLEFGTISLKGKGTIVDGSHQERSTAHAEVLAIVFFPLQKWLEAI